MLTYDKFMDQGPIKQALRTESRNPDIKPKFNNIQTFIELSRKSTKSIQLVRKHINLPKPIIRHEQNASVIGISMNFLKGHRNAPVCVHVCGARVCLHFVQPLAMMLMITFFWQGRNGFPPKPSQVNVNYKVAYACLAELYRDHLHHSSGHLSYSNTA